MSRESRLQVAIILGFCIVVYFVNLGQWDLWNPDEPRYGQVAREIVRGGDWILMHNNGKMYTDKPPLFFWLIVFSSYLWEGFSSFAVRFPSALFGTLTVLLTYLLGRNFFASRSGFLSALILATSVEFAYLATRANIDATLTFFTTASLFCFVQWLLSYSSPLATATPSPSAPTIPPLNLRGGEEGLKGDEAELRAGQEGSRNSYIYGFYVSMAFATVTKGPVGFILPLLVALIYLAIQRDWKRMKEMKLPTGTLLFLFLVLSWYIPAVMKGGKIYLNETLFKHSLNRYAEGWSHLHPFYYYFYNFPVQFLPWILFLPGAFAYGFSHGFSERGLAWKKAFLFVFVWFAVIFLFFSFSKGKRELYILPLYPAVSLMVGRFLDEFLSKPGGSLSERWVTVPLYGLMAILLLAGGAMPPVVAKKLPAYLSYSFPMAFLLFGGSLAMFFLARSRNYLAVLLVLVGIVGGGFFYTLRVVFPLVNPYKSGRYISEEITSRIQPGERLCLFGGFGTGPYNFYTGIVPIQEMEQQEELFKFLQSGERVFCILKLGDFKMLEPMAEKPSMRLISQRRVGSDQIVLISNR